MPLKYLVGKTKYIFKWRIFLPDDIFFKDPISPELSLLDIFGKDKIIKNEELLLLF